jgi:oligopeptide/dipeptide ABC transporter ATP-binding protein
MSNLDPSFTVGSQLVEPMRVCLGMSKAEAKDKALSLLEHVGIPDPARTFRSYPHEISGGMAQRVLIAGAVSCEPDLIIADEPTTALDVTIQAQILDLLRTLVTERGTALMLITHDLGVVAGMCERVNVMYAGTFVETGTADQVFAQPRHPYALGLLQSVPRLDVGRQLALHPIPGQPRNMLNRPTACPFAPRCRFCLEVCTQELPELTSHGHDHKAACFNPVAEDEWQRIRTGEHAE